MTAAFIQAAAQSIIDHEPLPACPVDLTLEQAYELQSAVAEAASPDGFAGIKAGVTNPALQKNFGIDHGLLGRLYASRRLDNGAELPLFKGQLLECEIGLILDEAMNIDAVALTVEFAFLKFSSPEDASAPNLVAANVATDAFMATAPTALGDWSDPTVRMFKDDELINEASILESLGGPQTALEWIKSEAARYKIPMSAGSLLMTGACGNVVPALPGKYRVICEPLGELTFSINE